jgi:hypothetical protein
MDERDRQLIRHLHDHFGTRPFSTKEASATTAGDDGALPADEVAWGRALEDLLKKELVIAEVEGWRLTSAVLRAASILNI